MRKDTFNHVRYVFFYDIYRCTSILKEFKNLRKYMSFIFLILRDAKGVTSPFHVWENAVCIYKFYLI